MRILAALLLLVASLLSALLGGGYLLSSRYQRSVEYSEKQAPTDRLSRASAQLSSPAELADLRAEPVTLRAKKRSRAGLGRAGLGRAGLGRAGLGHLLLGIGLTAAFLAGLLGVVLLFANRARRLVLLTIGLGLAASVAGLLSQGVVTLLAIAATMQLVTVPLAVWARRRPSRPGRKQAT